MPRLGSRVRIPSSGHLSEKSRSDHLRTPEGKSHRDVCYSGLLLHQPRTGVHPGTMERGHVRERGRSSPLHQRERRKRCPKYHVAPSMTSSATRNAPSSLSWAPRRNSSSNAGAPRRVETGPGARHISPGVSPPQRCGVRRSCRGQLRGPRNAGRSQRVLPPRGARRLLPLRHAPPVGATMPGSPPGLRSVPVLPPRARADSGAPVLA